MQLRTVPLEEGILSAKPDINYIRTDTHYKYSKASKLRPEALQVTNFHK